MRVKISGALAIAALAILLGIVAIRSRRAPVETETTPKSVETPKPAPPSPPVPEPSPVRPPAPEKEPDSESLFADLIRAVRNGDEKTTRSLLDKLRDRLLPPVPDEENAALLYEKAFALVGTLSPKGEEEKAYSALLRGESPSEEDLAKLRDWLERNAEVLAEGTRLLREAADLPRCRFTPHPDSILGPSSSTLIQAQTANNLLCIQAALGRMDGAPGESAENLRAALGLVRGVRSTPIMLSQMIACALETQTYDSLRREGVIEAAPIASFISNLDLSSARDAWKRMLLGETHFAVSNLLKHDSLQGNNQEVAVYLETLGEVMDLPTNSYAEGQLRLEALARKFGETSPFTLTKILIPPLSNVRSPMVASEVRASMMKVALELERYRARRGAYPQTLAALGTAIPSDPLTGQPFYYRREGGEAILEVTGDFPRKEKLTWRAAP